MTEITRDEMLIGILEAFAVIVIESGSRDRIVSRLKHRIRTSEAALPDDNSRKILEGILFAIENIEAPPSGSAQKPLKLVVFDGKSVSGDESDDDQ